MGNAPTARRWIIAGAAVAALIAAFALPRRFVEQPDAPASQSTVPPQLAAVAPSGSPAVTPSPASDLFVYVVGSVKSPGVYRLAQGARVIDAVAKAGGALGNADLEQVNLAEPLSDAMKIDVPAKGQILATNSNGSLTVGPGRSSRGRSRGHGGGRHKLGLGQTLDINAASAEELLQLPGVGPGLARRIVEYRRQNGPFESVDDLQNVSGVGPSKFEKLAPFVRL